MATLKGLVLRQSAVPFAAALFFLFASATAGAQSVQPVEFAAYDEVRGLDDYASPQAYAAAIADTRFVMEKISYLSDGIEVYAYVYRPVAPSGSLPVIIFNRGSWTWPGFAAEMVTMANRLAQQGYLVVAPMYRGSGGAAGRDEMGGADLNDLFNLLPVVRSLPYANPDRLYLYGESRGGMMVYQALRDGFPAKAAAVVGAFTDLDDMLSDERWAEAGRAIWPDLNSRRSEIVARRSAQKWADRIEAPVIILHGGEDRAVPPRHALELAKRLSAAEKPYQLIVVEGEGHTLAGRASERDAWVIDWFARH